MEDGFVDIKVYHQMRWFDGNKFHTKGKQTWCMMESCFNAEDLYIDIQGHGDKFHKIKKLHKKYKIMQTHWKDW